MAANKKLKVIAFNGPPRSGKDTLANALESQLTNSCAFCKVERAALSLPMRHCIFAMLGMEYSEKVYEEIKDSPQWTGQTLRRMMIDLSEAYVKPTYGKSFWTQSALARVNEKTNVLIISDLGFQQELDYLMQKFWVPNVLLVKVSRAGTSWDSDSRQPLDSPNCVNISNENSPHEHAAQIRKVAADLWNLARVR